MAKGSIDLKKVKAQQEAEALWYRYQEEIKNHGKDCEQEVFESLLMPWMEHLINEVEKNESLRHSLLMSPKEMCKTYNVQNCHFCTNVDCCDNETGLIKKETD